MSYRNKKIKKKWFSRLLHKLQFAKSALLKNIQKRIRRKKNMRLRQTEKVMQGLRERSRIMRANNLRINEWVDDYINECALNGKPVEILTQWCLSKDLEVRYKVQGNTFVQTKKERQLFEKDIPWVKRLLAENGIACTWWITFNRSYLDFGRIEDSSLEAQYMEMIAALAEPLVSENWLMIANWEDDILGGRPQPDAEVLTNIKELVPQSGLELEIERHAAWGRKEAGIQRSDEEFSQDVYFKIACEAEEGKLLNGEKSPFGTCLILPLESAERYDFFTLRAPGFKNRVVPVLAAYPWRLN